MNIALTGSSGMTGLHMKALLEKRKIKCLQVNRQRWDLTQYKTHDQLDDIFFADDANIDAVCHFGAFVPPPGKHIVSKASHTGDLFDANVRSCLALAEWATLRNIPVVFLSGTTVYKDPHQLSIQEDDAKVVCGFGGFYGYSKWLAENVFEHYREQGLQLVILRPSSVYGTFMPTDRLVASFLQSATMGEIITVMEPVENRINLIHAADIALASLNALQRKAWGTYNIGGPTSVTFSEVAKECINISGKGQIKVRETQNNVTPFSRFDLCCDKAMAAFNYKPHVNIIQGISAMKNNILITL